MDDQELLERLSEAVDGREVRLSLSDEGRAVLERMGPAWLAAVVRPLQLTYPNRPLELVLRAESREPFRVGPPIPDADLLANAFNSGNGRGLASVRGDANLEPVNRPISLPSLRLLDEDLPFRFMSAEGGWKRKLGDVYTRIYRKAPVALDRWRQAANDRQHWTRNMAARVASDVQPVSPTAARPGTELSDARPAVLFALHWLEAGGAEAWAFESIRLAREAGLKVIVVVDRAAPQRLFEQTAEMSDEVYLAANSLNPEDWNPFYRVLLTRHNFVAWHIHHSSTAYAFLPELAHLAPQVEVIDSTHIIEHRTGGFVRQSIENSDLIDLQHVISPQLRDEMVLNQGIDASKVIYAPLTNMSHQQTRSGDAPPARDPSRPLRIGFLGRLAAQKRPFLFVELVRRLAHKYPGKFEFVMQGSGALAAYVDEQVARARVGEVIERRAWGPANEFFADIDVLVISSDNEGLTLTALEADAQQVIVQSADVGSQITVVAPEVLVPRPPGQFLRAAVPALVRLADDPDYFAQTLAHQHEMHNRLRQLESASAYFASHFAGLTRKADS